MSTFSRHSITRRGLVSSALALPAAFVAAPALAASPATTGLESPGYWRVTASQNPDFPESGWSIDTDDPAPGGATITGNIYRSADHQGPSRLVQTASKTLTVVPGTTYRFAFKFQTRIRQETVSWTAPDGHIESSDMDLAVTISGPRDKQHQWGEDFKSLFEGYSQASTASDRQKREETLVQPPSEVGAWGADGVVGAWKEVTVDWTPKTAQQVTFQYQAIIRTSPVPNGNDDWRATVDVTTV